MLVKQVLVSALVAPLALGATNTDTVFAGFDNLHKRINSAHNCLKDFNGGVSHTLYCGFEFYHLLTSSSSARKDLAELDSVPADQVQEYLDYYHDIRSSVSDTLTTGISKVNHVDSAGLKMFAGVLLRNFASERATFEVLTKQKLPAANHSEIAGPIESLKDEFEKTLTVFV
ncbi:hypothetical protein ASPWEDRAFT_175284 [Aspergillus wentii DTO 134E9]|uniref:Uncharacterized protein n=1 Tax=Aspergillus wentii DTO 134E9 TaxID=1073089 RepID=A0A1L9RAL9_ASPWE|nr:uncharacterized protein ASPWEDRAFT_175284 [Aspergillus wentii DTO 134E9]KAI9934557.1 hypothetical protein MW887_000172 [Aspergillus wentii]OJJ31972.1 hypothetical protein ASPWEDRAFT_175284 [Aspergillus wentii DTO 134E9]